MQVLLVAVMFMSMGNAKEIFHLHLVSLKTLLILCSLVEGVNNADCLPNEHRLDSAALL